MEERGESSLLFDFRRRDREIAGVRYTSGFYGPATS
jgi:hypothetical protein